MSMRLVYPPRGRDDVSSTSSTVIVFGHSFVLVVAIINFLVQVPDFKFSLAVV